MQVLSLVILFSLFGYNPYVVLHPNVPTNPKTPEYYQVNILEKIDLAKKLVAKEVVHVKWCNKKIEIKKHVGKKIKKTTKIVRMECGREHALAVLNVVNGKIKTLRVGAMNRGQVKNVREFTVTRITENGVNSEYLIDNIDNSEIGYNSWVVVALKTMTSNPLYHGKFKPAVYVPYSERLNIPELRDEAMRHLLKIITTAYIQLDIYDTPPLRNLIPKEIILSLLLIEHMDPDEFVLRGAEYMISKVLTTIGANGNDAYRYAVSPANARGLAQFIPTTYADVVRLYAEARLHRNFVKGMTDHLNAVMAQICLANRDLDKLLNSAIASRPDFQIQQVLGRYLAAAYNGGPERAIRSCGNNSAFRWKEGSGLARQTVVYVSEFKMVYNYLFPNEQLE